MLKKLVTTLLLIFLFLSLFLLIAQTGAQAVEPITGPITPPVTTPVSFFNLSGKVTYHQLGRLLSGMQRFMDAANVVVKVDGFLNLGTHYQTTTDAQGMYQFNLPNGLYKVSVDDGKNTFFVPPLRVVNILNNVISHADFQGLLFPSF